MRVVVTGAAGFGFGVTCWRKLACTETGRR
jgi:hypothetical protein